MKTKSARLVGAGALLAAGVTLYTVMAQGPLTPPGPPAPTMKALDQIEPRTPINRLPVTISTPGSYYFTRSLQHTAASGEAILINASDVTLDLNGFTLSSDAGVTGSAIIVNTFDRVTIKNGNIVGASAVTITGTAPNRTWSLTPGGFAIGVEAVTVGGDEATDCRFLDLTCSRCRSNGLQASAGGVAERCLVRGNGNVGILVDTVIGCNAVLNNGPGIWGETVTDCTVESNGQQGIYATTVTGCTAIGNGGRGISSTFLVSLVSHCTSRDNDDIGILGDAVTHCAASNNGSTGILGESVNACNAGFNGAVGISGSAVTACTARSNGTHGIHATRLARDNTCQSNGTAAAGERASFLVGTACASRGTTASATTGASRARRALRFHANCSKRVFRSPFIIRGRAIGWWPRR